MAMIENIYETMNLRITETAFELHLRKIYPTRNILSMRETETISGQECLDVQKKTDGSVNIIGEVATDPVASWMIQSAQVASKFTLFTHHAKTFPNLITALRNSMLRAGTFKDEKTAEEQVVQVLNFNIHLLKDFRGRRYIERITECIPVEEKNEYTFDHRKEKTLEGKLTKIMDNATIFFSKTTNKELYKYHNILEFSNDTYVLVNPITEFNIREMRNNMEENDVVAFDAFLERNWGIKPPKMPDAIEKEQEVDLDLPTESKRIVNIKEEDDFPEVPEELKNLNMENLAKEQEDDKEEKNKARPVPQRPVERPTQRAERPAGVRSTGAERTSRGVRPQGQDGGVSRDAIRRSVGIRRPAGEAKAPERPTGTASSARSTRRPAPQKPAEDDPYKLDLSGLDDKNEE